MEKAKKFQSDMLTSHGLNNRAYSNLVLGEMSAKNPNNQSFLYGDNFSDIASVQNHRRRDNRGLNSSALSNRSKSSDGGGNTKPKINKKNIFFTSIANMKPAELVVSYKNI